MTVKVLIALFLVGLLAALLVGAWRAWQAQHPPINVFEGWQKITSDEMNIGFLVPKDWEYEPTNRSPQDQIMYAGPNGQYLAVRRGKKFENQNENININQTLTRFDANRELNFKEGYSSKITVRESAPVIVSDWSGVRRIESHSNQYEPEEIVTYINAYGYNYSISTWRREGEMKKPVKTVTPEDIALHKRIESTVQIWKYIDVRTPHATDEKKK